MISLYRSEELNIIACFTTSQNRAGVPSEQIKHGIIRNKEKEIISYVFLADVCVGVTPENEDFHFPLQTVIRFDYCFKEGNQTELLSNFQSPVIICKLNDTEYENLIYAMYKRMIRRKYINLILKRYYLNWDRKKLFHRYTLFN